jgi:hypothetical protein
MSKVFIANSLKNLQEPFVAVVVPCLHLQGGRVDALHIGTETDYYKASSSNLKIC